jgi:HSP20 family protein
MPMKKWGGGNVFIPAIDIKEEENKLLVTTNLLGINKEYIEINLKEDMLEISAKSGKEQETEEEGYIRKERAYTHFYRAVHLPTSVKEEGSTAKIENGVLTITLPKMELKEPAKKIQIEYSPRAEWIIFDIIGCLFMKGNEKIVEHLNARLADELTAINQYIVHAEMCENWNYKQLEEMIQTRAIA